MQEKQNQNPCTGYLCFLSTEGEEWAAMLVVEPGGLPQEFLYSGPLRPTPVQEILYQDALAGQARLSLVRSLLRGLRSRPALVAVRAEDAHPAFMDELRVPIVVLAATPEWLCEPLPAAAAILQRLEETAGVSEPMGRAIAALAYVVEFERRQKSGVRRRGAAEASIRWPAEQKQSLAMLGEAETLQVLDQIARLHEQAYGWRRPASEDGERFYVPSLSAAERMRTKVRYCVEALDLAYLYGSAPVIQTREAPPPDLEEDPELFADRAQDVVVEEVDR